MATHRTKLTASQRDFAVRVFVDRYTHCLKEISKRGLEGCAQLAREQTEAALVEFRKLMEGSRS